MPLYQVIALGIIQGLAEFLPVSSTAHLYLARWLFGWQTEGLDLDIMLHFGTLLAVVGYFLPVLAEINQQSSLLLWLALASIPVGVAGLLFDRKAHGAWRTPFVIGAMLIAVGFLLAFADAVPHGRDHVPPLTPTNFLLIGAAQAFAIIPGASRSGLTIAAAMLLNFDNQSAALVSYWLSIPPVAAATAKALFTVHREGRIRTLLNSRFAAGVLTSAITGYFTIAFFLDWLARHGLRPFAYYRVVFGIIVVALAFIRRPPR